MFVITLIPAAAGGTACTVTASRTGYPTVTHTNVLVVAGDVRRDDFVLGGAASPPTITQQPQPQTVAPGGTATFTVAASGAGTLTYQWQKNQANLSNGGHYAGATTTTLTITNADSNDAANYRCVVSNAYGNTASNEAALTVGIPSVFLVESRAGGQNHAGYSETGTWADSTAKSTASGCTQGIGSRWCTIGGTASAVFRFTPAAGGIYNVYTTNCTTSNSGNPMIHKVAHADGTATVAVCQNSTCTSNACNVWYPLGQYTLHAGTAYTVTLDGSTAAGSAPSGNAGRADAIRWELVSVIAPPTITQSPAAQDVCAGAAATFTVAATGSGPLAYQWQKNQANLSNGGHYGGVTTATLTVSNADANDAAAYRCVVSNAGGGTASGEAALTLQAATGIAQPPQARTVQVGETATFTVAATGSGTLGYQWQKDRANLSNGGHYAGVTTAMLTVSNADAGDAGAYRCVVTGVCGVATSSEAALTVNRPSADFDGDGDVDLNDFATFQLCYGGPNRPLGPLCTAQADFDGDGDVDLNDFATFQGCFNGPNRPPACAGP